MPPKPPAAKRNNTKPLHWNTISNLRVGKTLYGKEDFQAIATLDEDVMKELETKFSNAPPPKVFADQEEEATKAKGPKTAGILEAQRITNIEIMLKKFDATPSEIAQAVQTLDPLAKTLTLDNVGALVANSLKPEELEMAKAFAADAEGVQKLNKAEALAYHIARVPRWQAKIKTMYTMRTSDELVGEIRTAISTVVEACKQVSKSEKFKRVLAMVLAIGNYMNAGTAKGSARGFRIDSLQKLSETKMREGGLTLLHYVAATLQKKHPETLSFGDDMKSVPQAKRMAKEDIAKEVLTFQSCITVMGREVTAMSKEDAASGKRSGPISSPPPPPASRKKRTKLGEQPTDGAPDTTVDAEEGNPKRTPLEVAVDIHRRAENDLSDLKILHEDMLKRFAELATYLGEDARAAKIEELFQTVAQFIEAFNKCVDDNKKRAEDEARKERLAKRKAEDDQKRKARLEKKLAVEGTDPGGSTVVAEKVEG